MPYDNPRCIGTTDLGLSTLGRLQSVLAGIYLRREGVLAVYCSKLARSCESALCMGYDPIPADGLQELYAGEWDGLHFDEIRTRWPKLYEERSEKPWTPLPGSEDAAAGGKRFERAVRDIASSADGKIAVVAHASVMGLFICLLLGLSITKAREFKLAYGSVTRFSFDGENFTLCGEPGFIPLPILDDPICTALLQAAGTSESTMAHCRAVAAESMRICDELSGAGIFLDRDTVYAAAMLHDIVRAAPHHDEAGADLIERLGYPKVAACIATHHDLRTDCEINEAAVLHIADKLVFGAVPCTLEERFSESHKKCQTDAALQKHSQRLKTATAIRIKINAFCEKEVIV
jgi:putative nucleotidyltransferase with HDIG domain